MPRRTIRSTPALSTSSPARTTPARTTRTAEEAEAEDVLFVSQKKVRREPTEGRATQGEYLSYDDDSPTPEPVASTSTAA